MNTILLCFSQSESCTFNAISSSEELERNNNYLPPNRSQILRCQKLFAFVKHLSVRGHNTSISVGTNQNSYLTNYFYLDLFIRAILKQHNQLDQPFWDTNWLQESQNTRLAAFFNWCFSRYENIGWKWKNWVKDPDVWSSRCQIATHFVAFRFATEFLSFHQKACHHIDIALKEL